MDPYAISWLVKLITLMLVLPFIAPMLIELWLHRVRPAWFVRFSLWTLGEHSFTLRRPKRHEGNEGYREDASRVAMPTLEKKWNSRTA